MKYFFTSDTHFGHNNIINYCDRPFKDVDEMDNALISSWNDLVSNEDIVYILGDFAFKNRKDVEECLEKLNGKKALIRGNHDRASLIKAFKRMGYEVYDYLKLTISDNEMSNGFQSMILFHYPIEYWQDKDKGAWHLHGHMHYKNSINTKGLAKYDVGVDSNNYKPVSYEEIKQKLTHHLLYND